MLNWEIGDVTVSCIVEMELPIPYGPGLQFLKEATPGTLQRIPWLYPNFVKSDGTLLLAIQALLVDAPGMKLVVDTCIGNDRPRQILGGGTLQTDFLAQLELADFSRESVNAVVCTHLHG